MNRPFFLIIDSANQDEPSPRRFGSLQAALEAFAEYDERWQRFAWITQEMEGGSTRVHMRDGERFKLDGWHDVGLWQRDFGDRPAVPAEPHKE